MVVGSNPVDTQDCTPRIGISGSSEQMPDAVGAGPGRESVLERRALFLEVLRELLCQRLRGETAERTPSCNASNSPIFLCQHCQSGGSERFRNAGRDARLRKTGHCIEKHFEKVGFIQQHLQVFASERVARVPMRMEVWDCDLRSNAQTLRTGRLGLTHFR